MKKSPRDSSLGAQMSIALHLMRRFHQKAVKESGFDITMEQIAVMEVLSFSGNMSMTEISETLWKHNANISRIVDRLEVKKLVVRKQLQKDKRSNIVSITSKGKQVFEALMPIIINNNKFIISCLSNTERDSGLFAVKTIINHLNQSI